MGIIGFGQRRRTNKLLADQLSVMRTGRTQAELRDQARVQAAAEQEARILYKALTRKGTDPSIAAYYVRLPVDQRQAWRDANPGVIK
jgi:hypothetical protein